ncbi:hypothetical protein MHYP_G00268730 [Metynnis hypsauchen]
MKLFVENMAGSHGDTMSQLRKCDIFSEPFLRYQQPEDFWETQLILSISSQLQLAERY